MLHDRSLVTLLSEETLDFLKGCRFAEKLQIPHPISSRVHILC